MYKAKVSSLIGSAFYASLALGVPGTAAEND